MTEREKGREYCTETQKRMQTKKWKERITRKTPKQKEMSVMGWYGHVWPYGHNHKIMGSTDTHLGVISFTDAHSHICGRTNPKQKEMSVVGWYGHVWPYGHNHQIMGSTDTHLGGISCTAAHGHICGHTSQNSHDFGILGWYGHDRGRVWPYC